MRKWAVSSFACCPRPAVPAVVRARRAGALVHRGCMTSEPRQSAANRDGRDGLGRFVPGCPPGPGRPPVPDFRRVVAERLAANGGSVDAVLFELFEALRAEAAAGNIAAAKVLLDRLAPESKDAKAGPGLEELIAASGRPMTNAERAERIAVILRDAAMRQELDRQRSVLTVATWVQPADSNGEPSP